MAEEFQVVYEGGLRPGSHADEAIAALVQRFGMTAERAGGLLAEHRRRVVKRHLDRDRAERYRAALEEAGLLVSIEPIGSAEAGVAETPVARPPRSEPAPALSPAQPRPAADPRADGPSVGGASAGRGAGWIGRGFHYFAASALGWILATLVFFLLALLASFVPVIGGLVLTLFWPVFVAGFMLGAHDQDRGEPFRVGHLFAGFQSNAGQLVLMGLLYLLGSILILIFIVAGLFATMGPMLADMTPEALALQEPAEVVPMFLIWGLVGSLLYLPLVMLVLLAPPLVAIDGLRAWPAMKLSFRGCLANLLPFLVFGLLAIPLLLIAMVPLGLGLLVVWPALTAAFYAAYREIYHDDLG